MNNKRLNLPKNIKAHRFTGCTTYTNGDTTYCVCMNCYNTKDYKQVFTFNPIIQPNKEIRMAKCSSCGKIFKEETLYYKEKEAKKIREKQDPFKEEVNEIIERKKNFLIYKNKDDKDDVFKFEKGDYYKASIEIDLDQPIPDSLLNNFVKRFLNLRRYYKEVVRSSFALYLSSYKDNNAYSDKSMISKDSYYKKLQNEIIYCICRNKLLFNLWFTDYSNLKTTISKFSKKNKKLFIDSVLYLGRRIEEFEFLNFDYIFNTTEETEKIMERENKNFFSQYTSQEIEYWITVHKNLIQKLKYVRVGTDTAKQELPINCGDKTYQLTPELKAEYDRIIELKRQKESQAYDEQIKERQQREKEDLFFNINWR